VKVKIAYIAIGYANGEVIGLLRQRGTAIAQGKFSDISKIDESIDKVATEKKEQLSTPVSAFITFETQDGSERCSTYLMKKTERGLKNRKYRRINLLGEEPTLLRSTEPSNIIWENLEINKKTMKKRKCWVTLVVMLFILATFILFTFLKSVSGKNKLKYPPSVNCEKFSSEFDNLEQFQTYATYDEDDTMEMAGSGFYQCYC